MAATNDCILTRNMELPKLSAPAIDDCAALPPITCHGIYKYINEKNRAEYMYTWSVDRVVRFEPAAPPAGKSRFWRKQKTNEPSNDKFMVILRRSFKPGFGSPPPPPPAWNSARKYCGGPPPPPPPPPGVWRNGRPVYDVVSTPRRKGKMVNVGRNRRYKGRSRSRSSSRHRFGDMKKVITIELTQEENEKVLNDFLATFSTIYEGLSMEERGKAMREIVLEAEDSEYDSDSSGSSGTCSLADD